MKRRRVTSWVTEAGGGLWHVWIKVGKKTAKLIGCYRTLRDAEMVSHDVARCGA